MSITTTTCVTVHCDVCGVPLDTFDHDDSATHFRDTEAAFKDARADGWTVTDQSVSYGPRVVTGFAVCFEADADHAAARLLIVGSGS